MVQPVSTDYGFPIDMESFTHYRLPRWSKTPITIHYTPEAEKFPVVPSSDSRTHRNPFVPGVAKMPPYFGRRPAVDRVLAEVGDNLREPVGSSSATGSDYVYFYGPRGMGKTVQLNAFQKQIRQRDNPDVLLELSASMVRTEEAMRRHLSAPHIEMTGMKDSSTPLSTPTPIDKVRDQTQRWIQRFRSSDSYLVRQVRRLRPQDARVFAGLGYVNMALPNEPDISAGQSLRRIGGSTLITLDEAHTVEPAALGILLEAVQEVGKYMPVALVLAGTPDLPDVLGMAGASFWIRGQRLPIGLLAPSAARDVIEYPLLDAELTCNPQAVAELAAAADHYPWFLQLYGREAFDVMQQTGTRHFDVTECRVAIDRAQGPRIQYYDHLRTDFSTIEKRQLARHVAVQLRANDYVMTTTELEDMLHVVDPSQSSTSQASLRHTGYIVEGSKPGTWEPGLPSFMDYMIAVTESNGPGTTPTAVPPKSRP